MLRKLLTRLALRFLVRMLDRERVTVLVAQSDSGPPASRYRLAVLPNSLPFYLAWDASAGGSAAEALETLVRTRAD